LPVPTASARLLDFACRETDLRSPAPFSRPYLSLLFGADSCAGFDYFLAQVRNDFATTNDEANYSKRFLASKQICKAYHHMISADDVAAVHTWVRGPLNCCGGGSHGT
jgi:hypothetical protein